MKRRTHTSAAHHHPTGLDAPALLRAAGLRVTPVRVAVLDVLATRREAVPAKDLLAALPASLDADRVTVYRTLTALEESGAVHKVDAGDRVFRYSITDHAGCTADHHDHEHPHVVCDRCNAVQCLDGAVVSITAKTPAARRQLDRLTDRQVTLRGLCDRCAADSR